jgi:acyl-CoA synthetase (AMP-forming)/AMP-acid ligase II
LPICSGPRPRHRRYGCLCFDNTPIFFALCWGAQRAGLIYVAISCRLTAPEIAYIARDSGAGLLAGTETLAPILDDVAHLAPGLPQLRLGGTEERDLVAALAPHPETPIADERAGIDMLYSSGTTGKPKGVRMPLPEDPAIGGSNGLFELARGVFGFGAHSVYLSPPPLSRRAVAMVAHRPQAWRNRRVHGEIRSRKGARPDRTPSRHRQPVGADAFRAHAQTR